MQREPVRQQRSKRARQQDGVGQRRNLAARTGRCAGAGGDRKARIARLGDEPFAPQGIAQGARRTGGEAAEGEPAPGREPDLVRAGPAGEACDPAQSCGIRSAEGEAGQYSDAAIALGSEPDGIGPRSGGRGGHRRQSAGVGQRRQRVRLEIAHAPHQLGAAADRREAAEQPGCPSGHFRQGDRPEPEIARQAEGDRLGRDRPQSQVHREAIERQRPAAVDGDRDFRRQTRDGAAGLLDRLGECGGVDQLVRRPAGERRGEHEPVRPVARRLVDEPRRQQILDQRRMGIGTDAAQLQLAAAGDLDLAVAVAAGEPGDVGELAGRQRIARRMQAHQQAVAGLHRPQGARAPAAPHRIGRRNVHSAASRPESIAAELSRLRQSPRCCASLRRERIEAAAGAFACSNARQIAGSPQ